MTNGNGYGEWETFNSVQMRLSAMRLYIVNINTTIDIKPMVVFLYK